MKRTFVLDTTPLSEAARPPSQSAEADAFKRLLRQILVSGDAVYVPEIADYEVRRELRRPGRTTSLARLDAFVAMTEYLPITTAARRLAADLWAQARNAGRATADPKALDGDVILAAQALTLTPVPAGLVVVTSNVAPLSRYVPAQEWSTLTP